MPLLRVRGILVQAHWSASIPLVLYGGLLGSTRYLGRYPDLSSTAITAMTIASLPLGALSILLHEIGHSLQARREGLRADRITLWAMGGVSWNSGPRSPGAAFRLTAAGPLVSALLVVLFGAFGWLGRRAGLPGGVVGVAVLLAQVNAVMFAFNMLPMVPLDGGRILHSALWRLRGMASASAWAARVGIVVASTVIAFGAVAPFLGILPSLAGFTPGLGIMINGAIMLWMTLAYASAAEVRPRWSGEVIVGDLMETPARRDGPAPGVTIARFLEGGTGSPGYGTAASPVIHDGHIVGSISRGLAGQIPADQREATAVADVMLRKEDAVVLERQTPVAEAFRALQEASRRGVVLDRGQVTAIILTSDLADVLLRVQDAARGVVDTSPSSEAGRR
ncbi:MAG: site-2 protease family protein [Actinomycetota bacterium]|nr:site-2 protease family protein [Actinomycetota bacterium]